MQKVIEDSDIYHKILSTLAEHSVHHLKYSHEPVFTSEEAAIARGEDVKMGAKALVMFADKSPILVVLPGDKRLVTKAFKKSFSVGDLRMATPEEVYLLTRLTIGCIPPFGKLMGLKTYQDNKLSENPEIVFNAGAHTKSIKMKYEDYAKIEQPQIGDFSE